MTARTRRRLTWLAWFLLGVGLGCLLIEPDRALRREATELVRAMGPLIATCRTVAATAMIEHELAHGWMTAPDTTEAP